MKICMFVLNNCKRDARVLKEAKTLADAGHDVRIVAVLDKDTEPYAERDGFRIIRVARNPLHNRVLRSARWALAIPLLPVIGVYRLLSWCGSRIPAPLRPAYGWLVRCLIFGYRKGRRPLAIVNTAVVYFPSRGLRLFARVFGRPLTFIDYYSRSWKVVKNEPADVYHSHDLTTLPVGYMAKRRTGGKLVYDSHEIFTEVHYISRRERAVWRMLERYLIRRADAVVIPNELAARELSRWYGVGLPAVVRNCPRTPISGIDLCNGSLRESLGLPDKVPIIVHVGLPSRARGSEKLISAAARLDYGVIVFLGWGGEESELKALVRERGLEDRVLFAPPVEPEQVVGHISSADAGVMPLLNVGLNHYYATPNKLWECIQAGLPVVSSCFPGLSAIVEGYNIGRTCDPEDPEDIAAAIDWVLADKDRYAEMRSNALEAAKVFNWENESKKLLEVYERLKE